MKHSLVLILGFQFLVRFGATLLFIASQTVFFRQAGVEHLPALYSTVNLTFIGLQLFFLPFFRQHPGKNLGRLLFGFFLFLGLVGRVLPGHSPFGVAVLLLSVMVFELLFGQFFTLFLAETFPLQEGKAVIPLISAFAGISSVVAGISLRMLLTQLELSDLFLFGTITSGLACLVWLLWYRPDDSKIESEQGAKTQLQAESLKTAPLDESQKMLFQWVLILVGLTMLGKYWLDYQYSLGINQAFPTEKELASFIALFSSTTDFLVISSQILLTGTLLRHLKLATALYFMPVMVLLACIVHLPYSGFVSLMAVQFLYTYLTKTFFQPSLSLVFSVFPPDSRSRVMERFGLVASSSALAAGLFLAAGGKNLPVQAAFLALIAIFAACLWSVYRLDSEYVSAIIGALGRSDRSWQPSDPEILCRLDSETRKSWVQRMMGGEANDRLRAIPLIPRLLPKEASSILLSCLKSEEPNSIREAASMALVKIETKQYGKIDSFLLNDENDVRVRAALLETVGFGRGGERFLPSARLLLDSSSLRLQAAAAAVVGKHDEDAGVLEKALQRIWAWVEVSANSAEKTAGVLVMGVIGHEAFVPHLLRLALQNDSGISSQAVQALGKIPVSDSRLALTRITSEAADSTVRSLAEKERHKLDRLAEFDVIKVFECLNRDERSRLLGNRTWLQEPAKLNRMLQCFKIGETTIRRAWILFWAESDSRIPDVLQNERVCPELQVSEDSSLDPFEKLSQQLVTRPELKSTLVITFLRYLAETAAWKGFDRMLEHLLIRYAVEDACWNCLRSDPAFSESSVSAETRYRERVDVVSSLVNLRTSGRLPPGVNSSRKEGRFAVSLIQEILLESFGTTLTKRLSRVLLEPEKVSLHDNCVEWSDLNPAEWSSEKCRAYVEKKDKAK